ncbi:response regulator [Luteolibacter yonseiensis]|uniref:histidine kinase n=1 Tax=Luteolibacter yonseiensis TaxID=1144680 RepID=A0A934QZV3_9BACT|nr:response regulator [Luteolibacter yonseiensis]MBK1814286.1 response regulator [Luteolibacter yonseiensis]
MTTPKPIKFLLVDDLEENLVALEALLKRDGLELLKARSGQEALEALLVHEIALAFVDIQMPVMSGFELAEIMRSTERTRGTPIIFLTAGNVDQERRIRGYETGAIDFLPKPIDPTILLNKASVFFELAVQRQSLEQRERQLRDSNEKLAWSNAELANADKKKDEFLAMLAHELRNPLAPLLTGIEILLASPGEASTLEEIAGMMKRQVGQMAHLIDDLLDVSRINHGKIELQKDAVAMSVVVKQAVESVQPFIAAFQHELVVENSDPALTLSADYHRLTQVISNLLSNAAKYTPPGGRIILSVNQPGSDHVRISVRDNGKGIKPEHQTRIFELFDQGASGPKDGLGIGLTLVRSLVEMHGGTITVSSEGEGFGSEFVVEVPGVLTRSPVDEKPEPVLPASAGKIRVLVADDGKSTADILGMFFRMEGMECEVAYDGAEALAVAGRFSPELVCLDLGMPVLDGYQAASRMREICPHAYIVALSGWGSDEDRRRTTDAGFDEHLVKPVNPEELRQILKRVRAVRESG